MMGTGMVKDMKYSTVIVAAGRGQRMNLGFNKVYAKLSDGRTILEHAMDIFMADDDCLQITAGHLPYYRHDHLRIPAASLQ